MYQEKRFALALGFCASLWWVLRDNGEECMAGAYKATLPVGVGVRGSCSNCKQESRVPLGPYISSKITLPKIFRSPASVTLPKVPHTFLSTTLGAKSLTWAYAAYSTSRLQRSFSGAWLWTTEVFQWGLVRSFCLYIRSFCLYVKKPMKE